MRNPERINEVLFLLEQVWRNNPDLRFWQLLTIIKYLVDSNNHTYDKADPFYYEDDRLIYCLNKFLQKHNT